MSLAAIIITICAVYFLIGVIISQAWLRGEKIDFWSVENATKFALVFVAIVWPMLLVMIYMEAKAEKEANNE